MKVKELLRILNKIAPFKMQASFDNSGLIFGDEESEISKILVSLDITDGVIDEAKKRGANTIIAHHPLIYSKVSKITKNDTPLLYNAIKSGLNIIAYHTNFDIAEYGLNRFIALNLLKLKDLDIIEEVFTEEFYKIIVFTPEDHVLKVQEALFEAGCGFIGNYAKASFNIEGFGTFMPQEGAKPFIGEKGKLECVEEIRIETIVSSINLEEAIKKMKEAHPYEEVAYDVYKLENVKKSYGFGNIGTLEKKKILSELIENLKIIFKTNSVRFIGENTSLKNPVKKIAILSGSGGSLIRAAKEKQADCFITGDISYHHALDGRVLNLPLIEVSHFDSEKFFKDAFLYAISSYPSLKGVELAEIILSEQEKAPFIAL